MPALTSGASLRRRQPSTTRCTRHFRHRISPSQCRPRRGNGGIPSTRPGRGLSLRGHGPKVAAIKSLGPAVQGGLGFSTFDHSWLIRGIDQFMMDMVGNPPMAEAIMDRVLAVLRNAVRSTSRRESISSFGARMWERNGR